jgi:hypothetical protein
MRGRSRPSSRSATPDPFSGEKSPKLRVLEFLGLDADSDAIERLPVDVLVAAALECGLSARERALLVLQTTSGTSRDKKESADTAIRHLTEQLSRQELRQLEGWRKLFQQLQHRAAQYSSMSSAALVKRHLELAKDEQLSPTESLLLYATLHANEEQRLLLAAIVCCESDSTKMPMFNFSLAVGKGESYLSQYGSLLETLPLPLFPATTEFDLLNGKLLREYDSFLSNNTPSGGAAPNPASFSSRSALFRRQRLGNRPDVLGGGTLAVQQMNDNTYCVDTTQLENALHSAFDEAFKAIKRLEADVKDINDQRLAKEAKEKKLLEFAPLVRAVRRAVINVQRNTQHGHGYRSSPRHRRTARGGEEEVTSGF